MDVYAIDDEGHQPKDVCPYNSPMYKVLINYERQMLMKMYDSTNQVMGLSHSNENEMLHSN